MNSVTKKTEKLQKKFKVFYDSKIKAKTRLSALRFYLENVDIIEKRKICIENYDLIFSIYWKIFEYKHERLQALREKSDKPINPNNKEIIDILKVLRDSIRLLDFCLDGANKNCEDFDKLVEKSINSNVSYRIRVEGLSLLLLYINITQTNDPKYINLYKNSVHLDDFGTFSFPEPVDIATRNIDDLSLSVLSGKINRVEQSIEKTENEMLLFNIILDNILYLLYKQKNYPEITTKKSPIVNETPNKENLKNINNETNNTDDCNKSDEIKEDDITSKDSNESDEITKSGLEISKPELVLDDKDIIFDDAKADAPLNTIQDDNSIKVLNYMWNLFQIHYLDKFFPGIATNEVDINHCFSICPSIILKRLLDFCVLLFAIINESNGVFLNELSKNTFIFQYLANSQQDEIPIINKNLTGNGLTTLNKLFEQNGNYSIKQILLAHNNVYTTFCYEVTVNVELVKDFFFKNMYRENLIFEIFRQSFLQGYNKYEVIAEAIGILYTNIFTKSNNIYNKNESDCVYIANQLIKKFVKGMRLVFLDRKSTTNKYSKEKIYIFTKIFYIYQYIVTQTDIKLEDETWKTIFLSLLEIHNQILVFNKNTLYGESKDVIRLLIETMFYTWTQSPVMEKEYWVKLKEELSVSINEWEQVINEWNKIMTCLTYDLSQYAFNLNINEQSKTETRFKRNRSKSCVEGSGTNNTPIAYVGENDNKKQINNNTSNTLTTPGKYNNKSMTITNNDSVIINELSKNENDIKKIQYNIKRKLSRTEIMNIWKNTLCVIGNPNKIKKPYIYTTCMEGIEKIWNLLEKIRNNQKFVHNVYPPILEFSSWIFQSVDTPKDLLNGKVVAFRIMCKMMFHKFEYVKEKEYYLHFYLCILKGLQSGEDEIIFEIFDNCKSLYSNYLPGSSILIPPFIKAIKKMVVE